MATLMGDIKVRVVCFALLSPCLQTIQDHATKISLHISSPLIFCKHSKAGPGRRQQLHNYSSI